MFLGCPARPFSSRSHGRAHCCFGSSTPAFSVPLRVVALDEATKRIYRRTDSATLVALLPELRRLNKGAQKERERLDRAWTTGGDSDPSVSPGTEFDEKFSADLGAYVTAASEREMWIRNELKRRGLLPLWPGEQEHLDDDA